MTLKFVTGNRDKFREVERLLGLPLEQFDHDLPENQDLSAHSIIAAKLRAAEHLAQGEYLVEDTSLYLDCLGGKLPGPFIKWFEKSLGNEGIARLAERMGDMGATVQVCVGYQAPDVPPQFFESSMRGTVVMPRGDKDYGWGPIFIPEGMNRTFGELEPEEKDAISMRARALADLKLYLGAM